MLNGSCACGRIAYVIEGPLLGRIVYCHCWRCRKHSGSSFGTTVSLARGDLEFLRGEDLLSFWESSPGVHRYFASCCGSPIFKQPDEEPDQIGLRLGTLDDDPGRLAEIHFMTASKVPWLEIHDELPQQDAGGPRFGEKD